ncbi:MAG: hypothetical protein ACOX0V_00070 [Bacteroidales bacterium]|jgi:hypothetical protein
MKTVSAIILFSLLCYLQLFSQSSTFDLNSKTNQVSNLHTKYTFTKVYTYDLDLEEASYSYSANCVVVIDINSDGTGKIVTGLNGDKTIFSVVSCYKYDSYYKFEVTNYISTPLIAKIQIKNNLVENFYVIGVDNVAVVFSN